LLSLQPYSETYSLDPCLLNTMIGDFLTQTRAKCRLPERDNRRFESLANSVLGLDNGILSIMVVGIRTGSTLAEQVRSEFKQNFGSMSQRSNGMAGKWGILAFNSMERLEPVKSKAKYLLMVRENYIEMMFPANIPEDVMIGITIDPKAEAAGIYQVVHEFLSEESESIIARV
jgi:hypothetical protein